MASDDSNVIFAFPIHYRGRMPVDFLKAAAGLEGLDDTGLLTQAVRSMGDFAAAMKDSVADDKLRRGFFFGIHAA